MVATIVAWEGCCGRILRNGDSDKKSDVSGKSAPCGLRSELLSANLELIRAVVSESSENGEVAVRSARLLEELLRQDLLPALRDSRAEFFEACRDCFELIRFCCPGYIRFEQAAPTQGSDLFLPSPAFRHALLSLLYPVARECGSLGALTLRARMDDEGSGVIELDAKGDPMPLSDPLLRVRGKTKERLARLNANFAEWSDGERRITLVTFTRAAGRRAIDPSSCGPEMKRQRQQKTILLVDDEQAVRLVGRTALNHLGYNVLVAEDGLKGSRMYQERHEEIDLVLLDLVMPNMGGACCFERMKAVDSNVKVILMSGFTRNCKLNDLMNQGCLAFLRKPFELGELVSLVDQSLLPEPVRS